MPSPPSDPLSLLNDWWRRVREAQWAHYEAEKSLTRTHYLIGIPLVLLTAFSGTSVFYAISTNSNTLLGFIVGATSLLAAILGGLQTFLRLQDQAAAHRAAAVRYSQVRRRLEDMIANFQSTRLPDLNSLRTKIDEATDHSPPVPKRIWGRTEKVLASRQ